MAEYSSFFNSLVDGAGIYDREYNAEDFAEYFASFIGNGVYADKASELQVSAYGGNMSVIVSTGSAWINGYYYKNASNKSLTLSVADGALKRTDLIVVRLDLINRRITAEVVEGIPDTQGTVPELTRNTDEWEIALASVSIPANASEISQADITDLRGNSEYCGWVAGLIEQIDTTGIFAQYNSAFNTWFNQMKDQLTTDAAGHLQNEINDINTDIDSMASDIQDLNDLVSGGTVWNSSNLSFSLNGTALTITTN